MKNIFFLLLLFSSASFGQAQEYPSNKQYYPDIKELLRLKGFEQQEQNKNFPPGNDIQRIYDLYSNQLGITYQGIFSHPAANGSVYTISPDHMPDFVPETAKLERMPNRRLPTNTDGMPISGPAIKLISPIPPSNK